MQVALADKPAVPFRVPPGVNLVRVNPVTGLRAQPGDDKTILEAFKPGEEPPDPYSSVGYAGAAPEEVSNTYSSSSGGGYSSGDYYSGGYSQSRGYSPQNSGAASTNGGWGVPPSNGSQQQRPPDSYGGYGGYGRQPEAGGLY